MSQHEPVSEPSWASLWASMSQFVSQYEPVCKPAWASLWANMSQFVSQHEPFCEPAWASINRIFIFWRPLTSTSIVEHRKRRHRRNLVTSAYGDDVYKRRKRRNGFDAFKRRKHFVKKRESIEERRRLASRFCDVFRRRFKTTPTPTLRRKVFLFSSFRESQIIEF